MKVRFVKNALSNLSRGGAAAVFALVLPPILIRHMTPASYAVWVLILQVVSYLGYLDFGLQTAVGRYVAIALEKKDKDLCNGVFSTAFAGLSIAALLGMILIGCVIAACPLIFAGVPPVLLAPMRISIAITALSVAVGLQASALNGVFVGMQRYEIPAFSNGLGKLLSAGGLIWAAFTGRSLIVMAIVVAISNLISNALQLGAFRVVAPEVRLNFALISRPMVRELTNYCVSLTVWSFSMLLVSGIDVVLVGRFQFSAVAPYSVSATLITFLGGIQYAIFGVIMPHAAGLSVKQSSDALGDLLISSTKLGVLILLLTGLPLLVFATPLIRAWIGPQYAISGGAFLIILVVANMVRLTGAPYGSILIGAGQQKLVIVGPVMEGVTNLTASVLLGWKYGAIGVAWGTLIGAVVGVLATIFYNLAKTQSSIRVSQFRYVFGGLGLPALCGVPVYLVLLFTIMGNSVGQPAIWAALAVSFGLCLALVLKTSGLRLGSREAM